MGNIFKLPNPVEAIAYPFTGNPDFIVGVLDQIRQSAGSEIFDEVAAKQKNLPVRASRRTGEAYTSSAGNLHREGIKVDRIVHVVVNPKTQEDARDSIEKGVKGALETAALEGIRSIALPLFGTGGLATYPVSAAESLKRTIVAAEDFVQAHPDTPTKDIRVVAYYEPRENVLNGIQKTLAELNQQ